MPSLRDLEASFIKIIDEKSHRKVESIEEADGVFFLCPKCFVKRNGKVGVHGIICWRPRVSQTRDPKPGRWEFVGTSLDDLSLVAGSSSVLLTSGCKWHGFVKNGIAE